MIFINLNKNLFIDKGRAGQICRKCPGQLPLADIYGNIYV